MATDSNQQKIPWEEAHALIFNTALAPHRWPHPREQERLDACHGLAVLRDHIERLEEQLEALQNAVDDAALVFVDTMWFNAYNHLASTANASLNNRCDHPGCLSRATSGYLVGLGGMVAYYCADHAPASTPASSHSERPPDGVYVAPMHVTPTNDPPMPGGRSFPAGSPPAVCDKCGSEITGPVLYCPNEPCPHRGGVPVVNPASEPEAS